MQKEALKYYLIILSFFFSLSSFSQNILGKVTSNGEALPYVNLFIENTIKGAVSDEDGAYTINNIKAGTYTLVASYTGFKSQKKIVTVTSQDVEINFDYLNLNIWKKLLLVEP